jgi:hypothetical protein
MVFAAEAASQDASSADERNLYGSSKRTRTSGGCLSNTLDHTLEGSASGGGGSMHTSLSTHFERVHVTESGRTATIGHVRTQLALAVLLCLLGLNKYV